MNISLWFLVGALAVIFWELSGKVADWLTPKILSWIRRRKDGD